MSQTPAEILAFIASDNSKLFKEAAITRQAELGNAEFFAGLYLALDDFQTFGVKNDIPEHDNIPEGPGVPFNTFRTLCEQLQDRELTGDDARLHIHMLMNRCTKEQWNGWYRRILMKDLKAGFSETTVNKATKKYPEYQIPIFSCQLAHDCKDQQHRLTGKKLIDTKFDGARVLTFVHPNGTVIQTSRNGKLVENFGVIRSQFEKIAMTFTEPMVFDGEMMSASFQDLMTQFKRKTGVNTLDAQYFVFDYMPLSEFKEGKSVLKQKTRHSTLSSIVDSYRGDLLNVVLVEYEEIDFGTPKGWARFKIINNMAIKGGYEGLMIKDPEAIYECKRTWAWMKMKPVISVTLTIDSVSPGKVGSKYESVLGAFECSGYDESVPGKIEVSCGGGFSDEQRRTLWAIRDQLVGIEVEVEADAITKDSNGNYSLRFPRFKTFRGQIPGEKI